MIPHLPLQVLLGVGACALALVLGVVTVLEPGRMRLPASRRRPGSGPDGGLLSRGTSGLTDRLSKAMEHRDLSVHTAVLTRAGVRVSLAVVALRIAGTALVVGMGGGLLLGKVAGLLLAVAVPVVARGVLGVRASRRRRLFGDQLEDTMQLMASSLRAGHSLPQALAAVARDAEEPTREEFSRILNETRVGRDVGVALDETAMRMANPDFGWVSQAIGINREVGGNLAEVLDQVAATIRERNQLRRQVSALSAEGRLTAYILMVLPFAIAGFLLITSPSYLTHFTQGLIGPGLIGLCVVMLLLGWLWLRKIIRFNF